MNLTPTALEQLEQRLGADWESLRRARQAAQVKQQLLQHTLSGLAPEDTTIVVFGSVARGEVTEGSDIDWTLLVDGLADPQHLEASLDIQRELNALGMKAPGRERTFGGLAFSHDILHNIGGDDDSNRNTTQRILLLLESVPIGDASAYARVLRNVLRRYTSEDDGWMHKTVSVPRSLLNDIARYWRTVAVDFAYKRRQRGGSGWALRTVKLRMSRKLTYASGLLACFSVALDGAFDAGSAAQPSADRTQPVVNFLFRLTRVSPLELLASSLLPHQQLDEAAAAIFSSYDAFLGILNDRTARDRLEGLAPTGAESDSLYQAAREISHRFQNGLTKLFLEENGTRFPELTRKYGVF